ncbi:MAG: SprT family zinc-dependent metalloprotease [Bacillota bacterium]
MSEGRIEQPEYLREFIRKPVKRLTLRISGSGVLRITVPLKMPQQYVEEFLESKRAWIVKHIKRINHVNNIAGSSYCDGQLIRLLDKQFVLRIISGNPLVIVDGTEIAVYCHEPEQAAGLLENYIVSYAQRVMRHIYDDIWTKCGELFPGQRPALTIKAATSKWGSYSRRTHRVMLNEKLVRYPKRALELIIVHEICHIIELNHGRGFYRLLAQLVPDWKERKKLLKS